MARNGSQVTWYIDNDTITYLASQALKLGISRSKAIKMAVDLWRHSDHVLTETFGERIPTSLELLSQMVAVEMANRRGEETGFKALSAIVSDELEERAKEGQNAQA